MSTERPDRSLKLLYGDTVYERIINSNVLIGGAGGVGCEIIKSLSKCGFRNFTLVDLDTIEITNLNRQFYFRKRHVGKAKSHCAKEGVQEVEPDILNVDAILGNIYDSKFNNQFYSKFDIAFCAFDNQGARRHFGKGCSQANVPMVEAGTSAFEGNVSTRLRGLTKCRNCTPEDKTIVQYNVCSIRTRPSEPIHCIVWAQNMFNLIFGPSDDQNALDNYIADVFPEGVKNVSNVEESGRLLFERIFNTDIQKCDEKVRFPISLEQARMKLNTEDAVSIDKFSQRLLIDDERILTVAENTSRFLNTFQQLMTERKDSIGTFKYDKDDALANSFVSSIANIRTYNFLDRTNPKNKLEYQSEHAIRKIAGNIIPAIASTNAIVSAIQINEAIKIMKGYDKTRPHLFSEFYISNQRKDKISLALFQKPNLKCAACSLATAQVNLKCDWKSTTLGQFRTYMQQNFQTGDTIIQNASSGAVFYDPSISKSEASGQVFQKSLSALVGQGSKNPIESSQGATMSLRLFDLSSLVNWEIQIENDLNAPPSSIACDPQTTPSIISAQHLKFLRISNSESAKEKMSLMLRHQYVTKTQAELDKEMMDMDMGMDDMDDMDEEPF